MKLLSVILLSLVILPFTSPGQTNATVNSLAFPSANNAFLWNMGTTNMQSSVQVDQYTGRAQVKVPICDLLSKELTIPVSLDYVAGGGVRVQDMASSVGLGWQLNAGGKVTRVVRGFPDENPNGYIGTASPQWGVLVMNWLRNGSGFNSSQAAAIGGTIGGGGGYNPPTADAEPDIFSVQTPFFSFQFTFDENGNPVLSNDIGFKIVHNLDNNSSYLNTQIEVIDDQGNQYYFGTTGDSRETATTTIFAQTVNYTSAWYLDKIVTFNSRDVITFTYQAGTNNDVVNGYGTIEYYIVKTGSCAAAPTNIVTADANPVAITYQAPKFVRKIISKLGEVDFGWVFDRTDDANSARLLWITLSGLNPQTQASTVLLKTFNFYYGYFGLPSTDPNQLRLRLDAITLVGTSAATSNEQVFKTFSYISSYSGNAISLPARNSSAFDYWGYYNLGNSGVDPVVFPAQGRVPNYGVFAGLLNSISDITGGTTAISYEPNTYFDGSNNITVGGARVTQIAKTLPTGESVNTQYSYNDGSGHSTGQILSPYYNQTSWYFNPNVNGGCSTWNVEAFSQSPFDVSDLAGNFVGYSSVKQTDPNGGFTISTFKNFSDFPDGLTQHYNTTPSPNPSGGTQSPFFNSTISYSYKRGLPVDQTVYTATSSKVSEQTFVYGPQENPTSNGSYGFHPLLLLWSEQGLNIFQQGSGSYYTVHENYRVTSMVKKQFDQNNQGLYTQQTVAYGYAGNHRLVQTVTTSDSRGASKIETVYHADDSGIPDLIGGEPAAVSTLVAANRTGVVLHSIENHNGTSMETHNSYLNISYDVNHAMPSGTTTYFNGSQARQRLYLNDVAHGDLITSQPAGGVPVSRQFGYNGCYAVAEVKNATNTVSYTAGTGRGSGTLIWNPGVFSSQQATFTQLFNSTITFSGGFSEFPGSAVLNFNYTLQGPVTTSGTICINGQGGTCSFPPSVTLNNIPPGQYTLTVAPNSNNSIGSSFTYTYQASGMTDGGAKEFFFEGFEENSSATSGAAHTGNYYYNGNYAVNFTIPNSRSYVIQWWGLSGGAWTFHEQPYTGSTTLTGPVDDVRIFPSDAQMTTYTFQPQVGKTSETDPSGRSTYYQYDGLQRQNLVLDQNGNITKKYSYSYAGAQSTRPVIKSTAFGGPGPDIGALVSFIPPAKCETVLPHFTDLNTGQSYIGGAGGPNSPALITPLTSFHTYSITIYCYSSAFPSPMISDPFTLYVPF